MEAVVVLIDFGETWTLSDPMPRYVAEHLLADFAHGIAWLDGRHPTGALICPASSMPQPGWSSSQPVC